VLYPLVVVIVTNRRNPDLLQHLVWDWEGMGAHVVVRENRDPARFADDLRAVLELQPRAYTLIGADDVLPVATLGSPGTWDVAEAWPGAPGTIQAIRLIDVEGRRFFDWARWKDGGGLLGLQDYSEPETPETYITGNAQVWSPEALAAVRWPDGGPGSCDDVRACRLAQAAGIRLLPPAPNGPTAIHLERRYPVLP
jgi:hypothetical protein